MCIYVCRGLQEVEILKYWNPKTIFLFRLKVLVLDLARLPRRLRFRTVGSLQQNKPGIPDPSGLETRNFLHALLFLDEKNKWIWRNHETENFEFQPCNDRDVQKMFYYVPFFGIFLSLVTIENTFSLKDLIM